ncbi:MAG: hypothetical protein KAS29_13240, partial [Bacteroidales bacterium]|nr:hypothetical protein [Bacteroidales bacterium]
MCSKSNRNGIATVACPKKLKRPDSAKAGYLATDTEEAENQPANRTKLIVNILPAWGKLND